MKAFRLFLFFLVGLLLGQLATLARAETIAATTGGSYTVTFSAVSYYGWASASTRESACNSYSTAATTYSIVFTAGMSYCKSVRNSDGYTGVNPPTYTLANCNAGDSPTGLNDGVRTCKSNGYTCPSTGGWTLSGTNCTRPDCPTGVTRQSDGTCSNPCPTYPPATPDSLSATQPSNCQCPSGTEWYAFNGCRKSGCGTGDVDALFGVAIPDGASEACYHGCLVQHKAGAYDQYKGYRIAPATYAKWACAGNGPGTAPTSDNQPTPDAQTQDPSKKKDPPCAAGEGVITSSSGGVKCLPEGTPNTSKPGVEKKSKTETFPDNSTRTTTETTTRDPNTNATSVSTSTTSTGGLSGTAGTSTSQTGTTGKVGGGNGNGTGDGDGSCDPTLNFCGGPGTDGLYTKKEKTMSSVFTDFQNTVKGSPIGSASTSFFTVSTPSGSCPNWSVTVPLFNITLNAADYFCNGSILTALQGAGYVMLALATYIAFTWAFL